MEDKGDLRGLREISLFDLGWSDGYHDFLPREELMEDEEYMEGYAQGEKDC